MACGQYVNRLNSGYVMINEADDIPNSALDNQIEVMNTRSCCGMYCVSVLCVLLWYAVMCCAVICCAMRAVLWHAVVCTQPVHIQLGCH